MFTHILILSSFFIFGHSGIYWSNSTWYTSSSPYPWSSSSYPWSSSSRGSSAFPPVAPKTIYCNNYRDVSQEFPKVGDLLCKVPSYAALHYRYHYPYNYQPDELLSRETLVQTPTTYPSSINYYKTFTRDVSRVNILNFGEVHGFVKQIVIKTERYAGTSVTAAVDVPEGQEVKMFVEIYGKKL